MWGSFQNFCCCSSHEVTVETVVLTTEELKTGEEMVQWEIPTERPYKSDGEIAQKGDVVSKLPRSKVSEPWGSPFTASNPKKQHIKSIVSDFRKAATVGIPCVHYKVDAFTTVVTCSTLLFGEDVWGMKTIILVPNSSGEFLEMPLHSIEVFDYARMQEHSLAPKMLMALQPEERPVSIFLVSNDEPVLLLVEDQDMRYKAALSLRVLSDFARFQRSDCSSTTASSQYPYSGFTSRSASGMSTMFEEGAGTGLLDDGVDHGGGVGL